MLQPLSPHCSSPPFLPKIPNQLNFEQHYRHLCDLLLTFTRSRALPKGLQIHAHVLKLGFQSIPLVSHHLINFYSKTQFPAFSRQIFDEAPFKVSTTWSSVISSFAQNELPCTALEFFCRMIGTGFRPDDHTYPSAMKSCAILGRVDVGRLVHGVVIKTGYEEDVFVGSSMVDMYAKCGEIWDARKVFDKMPERNVVSWTGMIFGYAQLGENEEALKLFKYAVVEGVDVNDFTFSSAVHVCGNSTLLELGKQIHGMCLKKSYDSSGFVGSGLISLYSKCGIIEGAYRVFDEVKTKNVGLWNSMLISCAQHAHSSKVLDLFRSMESEGTKPNFITFLSLLYACSHAGLVKEGQFYFHRMKKYGIEPGHQHYATLVDLLGRAGKLQEALSVIKEMPIQPTESVWGALLTGCRLHGNTELAAYAADKVFELGNVGSGLFVLLCNAYAAAGRLQDAAKVRMMLRDSGIKKETGLSWLEEGNKVHTFAAGDRCHPKSQEIYQKLEEIGEELERAGYIADTSFVLQQVDDDIKKQTIRYHSERLAIAYALISFPPDRPIRIMKNLRVCGDCHTAIKFMSKCTRRIIIVRDNNRFHRFEDGKCSCGDYW
ncbi:putative pentatricopeptide repeat-containing protein At5g52630 [Chenopodium quinoa]|uniref:DYW domain-containing protein n=1 Tax=Chenopodium quinoa TaxID=63459 RepID=A0A803MA87_CHEQI|nr:putative pentatricopeptide repeat-containing protein At5g52630 [Chenopodium quinoa]